jgi:hypothetical protein
MRESKSGTHPLERAGRSEPLTGLRLSGYLFAESHRGLGFFLSQALVALEPLLGILGFEIAPLLRDSGPDDGTAKKPPALDAAGRKQDL